MRVIIHIGTEKTGSTALQSCLFSNEPALNEAGYALFRFSKDDPAQISNNRQIVAMFQDMEFWDDYFVQQGLKTAEGHAEFCAEVTSELTGWLGALPQKIHTVILTSEHFHSLLKNVKAVQALSEFLAPLFDQVRVIGYFREQGDMCLSFYTTRLLNGETRTFETFAQECVPESHYYNYLRMFSLWGDTFGDDALTARIYDRKRLTGGDICTDFCAAISELTGKPVQLAPGNTQPVNQGLGAVGQYLLRQLNKALPAGSRLRVYVLVALRRLRFLDRSTRTSNLFNVYDDFDADNREFAARFLWSDDNPFHDNR